MDAHLVHRSADGKLLVLAVQFEIGDQPNPVIQTMLDRIPKEKGAEFKINEVMVNPLDLLPKQKSYYTYNGSLTTPPCGVPFARGTNRPSSPCTGAFSQRSM